jgi:hypothetical protein
MRDGSVANGHKHTGSHIASHPDADCGSDRDPHAHSDADCGSDRDPHAHSDADRDPHADHG